MYRDDPEARDLFQQGKFQIVRKAPDKMLSMRRIVYDNDHPAKDLIEARYQPRWAAEKNKDGEPVTDYLARRKRALEEKTWTGDDHRGFTYTGGSGGLDWLRYRHLVVERSQRATRAKPNTAEIRPELITDFIGYNTFTWPPGTGFHSIPSPNWVGDLILECEVTLDAPVAGAKQSEFVLELSRGTDRYQARWDLNTGECTLVRIAEGTEEQLDKKPTSLKGKGKYHLRFANVDEQLVVWIDNSLPFGPSVPHPAPAQRGPYENDLEPASIAAQGAGMSVHKLQLWRDTYYTLSPGSSDTLLTAAEDWSDPERWGPLRNLRFETLYVQPGHYLCMGDNSPESSDGRSWGLVPKRLLLGRALLIYFPFSRAGRIQ
jgi:signal peptidase I